MIIIIDGYNVLKLLYGGLHIGEAIRTRFLKQLISYGNRKGHTLLLIYDGGPDARSNEEKHGNVIVIFAGHRQTADDYIKHYIDTHRNSELVLVSNDRELSSYAQHKEVPSINVSTFCERMQAKEEQNPVPLGKVQTKAHKMHGEEINPELDAMLEQTDILEKKEEAPPEDRLHRAQTFSKRQRMIQALLKKL